MENVVIKIYIFLCVLRNIFMQFLHEINIK